MVEFKHAEGTIWVHGSDSKRLGYISRPSGDFVIDPKAIRFMTAISIEDLQAIIRKGTEIRQFGITPKICESCGGTPLYPNKVHSPNEGVIACSASIHPLRMV